MKRGDGVFFFGFPLLQGDLEVAVQTSTVGDLRGRNILRALFHPIFNEIGKHDNHFALLLPYHPPKVGDSRLHWRLASDVIFRRVLWPLKNRQRIKKKKKKETESIYQKDDRRKINRNRNFSIRFDEILILELKLVSSVFRADRLQLESINIFNNCIVHRIRYQSIISISGERSLLITSPRERCPL